MICRGKSFHLLAAAAVLLGLQMIFATSTATGLAAHAGGSGVGHSEAASVDVLPLKQRCNSTIDVCAYESEITMEEALSRPEVEWMMESFTSGRLLLQTKTYISGKAVGYADRAVFNAPRARPYGSTGRGCNPIYGCKPKLKY